MTAFEDAINATSTPWAPWYVIPADRKWAMRAAVSDIITTTIKGLDLQYPTLPEERAGAWPMRRRRCSPSGAKGLQADCPAGWCPPSRIPALLPAASTGTWQGSERHRALPRSDGDRRVRGEGDLERCMVDNSRSQRDEGVDAVGPEPLGACQGLRGLFLPGVGAAPT